MKSCTARLLSLDYVPEIWNRSDKLMFTFRDEHNSMDPRGRSTDILDITLDAHVHSQRRESGRSCVVRLLLAELGVLWPNDQSGRLYYRLSADVQ